MKNTIIKVLSVVMAMVFAFGSCIVAVSATTEACDHANATVYGQVEADCETWGYTLYECPDCDEYFTKDNVNELIPPHCLSDGWTGWVEATPVDATCVSEGYETKTCPVCEKTFTTKTADIDPDAHVWGDWVVTDAQTCTGEGVKARTCTLCEKVETEDVAADGHTWIADEANVVAPTCQEEGSMPYYCANCDATRDVVIRVCGHFYVEMDEVEAACGTQGHSEGRFCKWCLAADPTDADAVLYPMAMEHNWVEIPGADKVDATCTTPGYYMGRCSNCGEEKKIEVTVTHEFGDTATYEVAATCTTWGYKLFGCKYCGEIFINESEEPLGHNYVLTDVTADPTCTTPGGVKYTCDFPGCGATKVEADPDHPALGHDWTEYEAVAPDCLNAGTTAGQTCNRCGETTVEVVPALNHNEKNNYICTTDCKMDVYCALCGILLEEGVDVQVAVNATESHVWEVEVLVAADCEKDGQNKLTCKYCGKIALQKIDAYGHDAVESIVDPTCSYEGHKLVKCATCEKVLENTIYPIVADAHVGVVNTALSKAPTCEADGKEIGDCKLCNKPYEKTLPATGHSNVTVEGYPATCVDDGLTDGVQCETCGKWATAQVIIPALGHDLVTYEKVDATCTTAGSEAGATCTRCDYTQGLDEIPALDHDGYSITGGHDASCANGGSIGYVSHWCAYCDDAYIDNYEYAPEHTLVTETPVPVTCTTDGYTLVYCTECDYEEIIDVVEAEGHKDAEGNVISTACNRGEIEDTYCVVCECDIEAACDWIFVDFIPATCKTYQHDIYVCGICGEEKLEIVKGLGGCVYTETREPATGAATFTQCVTITNVCDYCGDTIVTYETAGVEFTTKVVNGTGADVFVNGSKELKVEIYMKGDKTTFNTLYMQYKFNSTALEYKSATANTAIVHSGEFEKNLNGDVLTMSFTESNDGGKLGSLELTGEDTLFVTIVFKIKDSYVGLGQIGAKDTAIGNIESATLLAIDADNNAIVSVVGNTTPVQEVYLRGDITGDGKINSHDLVAMRALIANGSTTAIGDISLDGNVNQADFIILRNWVIGALTYPATSK